MSYFFEPPARETPRSIGGGEASLGTVFQAVRDSMLYAENVRAELEATERAIAERNASIRSATGRTLDNPLLMEPASGRARPNPTYGFGNEFDTREAERARRLAQWRDQVAEIAALNPELAERNGWGVPLDQAAAMITRQAQDAAGSAIASRDDFWGKWTAILAGGMAGAVRDPIQVVTLFAGGGPGAARTTVGRILTTAVTEAAVNAGVEAMMQPAVLDWQKRAGLDVGLIDAIRNVAFAGAIGGVFGAAGGSASALIGRLSGRALEQAAADVAARPEISPALRGALEGDTAAARRILPEIRDELPAEARGALDQAEILDHLEARRPPAAAPEAHDLAVSAAARTAQDLEPPAFELDAAQTRRVADELIGIADDEAIARLNAEAGRPEPSLVRFLIAAGGIRAEDGELAAIGADRVARRFQGRLVTADGRPLDAAREAAAEAGYLDDLYGFPEAAIEKSTVADFLDLIDRELRGDPVYPHGREGPAQAENQVTANRVDVERRVAEMQRLAGPGVSDEVLARAVDLESEGVDPGDALERAVMDAPEAARAERAGEPLPGWSDEELLAASRDRAPAIIAEGLDDPAPKTSTGADTPAPAAEDVLVIDTQSVASIDVQNSLLEDALAAVKEFARTAFAGKTIVNRLDGSEIMIPWQGIKKALSRRPNRLELAATLRLDELIAGARFVETTRDRKGRGNVTAIHLYERKIEADGSPATMRIVVREHLDGRRYYQHAEKKGGDLPGEGGGNPSQSIQDSGTPPQANIGNRGAAVERQGFAPEDLELEVPNDVGELVQLSAYLEDLDRQDYLATIVEACRV